MPELVYDTCYPGGLHMLQGRVVDATGVPLDGPPDAAPIGVVPDIDDDRKALAAEAATTRLEQWQERQAEIIAERFAPEIDAALGAKIADLPDVLADLTDRDAIQAAMAADERVTAQAVYEARLAELGVVLGDAGDAGTAPATADGA